MKNFLALALVVSFGSLAVARENCESVAVRAAGLISQRINEGYMPHMEKRTISNSSKEQIVNVVFDRRDPGAHVGYTVTIQRNPSPIEKNQTCARVVKLELTSEE